MRRFVFATTFVLVLLAGAGCGDKSNPEITGVSPEKNPDPKAPGAMRPPGEGNTTLPKGIDKTKP